MISDVQRCTYNTPIQQGETKLIAQMRKEEFIMEGFKYYDEVARFFGPKLMEVFETEGRSERECGAENFRELWKQLFDKLEETNKRGYSTLWEFSESQDYPERCRRLWETYTIGVSILLPLSNQILEKGEVGDWDITDLAYNILHCMGESYLYSDKEIHILLNAFFLLEYVNHEWL